MRVWCLLTQGAAAARGGTPSLLSGSLAWPPARKPLFVDAAADGEEALLPGAATATAADSGRAAPTACIADADTCLPGGSAEADSAATETCKPKI